MASVDLSLEGEAPLSFPQQLLEFLEQLRPGGAGTRFALVSNLLLEGTVDVAALRWAVRQVSLRHDVLRTVVVKGEGVSVQRVAEDALAELHVLDLDGDCDGREAETMTRRLDAANGFDFDLGSPPFLRVFLGRLTDRRHVLTVVVHHGVSDHWSLAVLERDLAAFYRARRDGTAAPAPLEWQYSDYTWHQHRHTSSQRVAQALRYWHEQLDGLPATRFPVLAPVSQAAASEKQSVRFEFGERLSRRLIDFARVESVTLFTFLLAVYALLLADLTGQWDVAVPTLVADRGRRQTHDLVGFLINGLLLRTRLQPSHTGREALTRVRDVCVGALRYHDLPLLHVLDQVTDAGLLFTEETYAIMPLQVVHSRLDVGRQPFGQGCTWSRLAWQSGTNDALALPVDGLISISVSEEHIAGTFCYSPALFGPGYAEAVATGLREIARRLVDDLDRPVGQLLTGLR